ncbi:MAG: hypothetical protein V4717_20695 [Bacteroidota bacterium]
MAVTSFMIRDKRHPNDTIVFVSSWLSLQKAGNTIKGNRVNIYPSMSS